ncbi:hypothetical protein ACFL05_00650 [Patescibacteria group bacterium]
MNIWNKGNERRWIAASVGEILKKKNRLAGFSFLKFRQPPRKDGLMERWADGLMGLLDCRVVVQKTKN